MDRKKALLLCMLWVALGLAATGQAVTRTTTASGLWTNAATWTSGNIPGADEDAVIGASHVVTVDVSTASMNILTNNGTLVFSGSNTVITSTWVTVVGTVTQLSQTATATNTLGQWEVDAKIAIVCSNLTVEAGGKINATAAGFGCPDSANATGYGPGGGIGSSGGGGGGYGGKGGNTTGNSGIGGPGYGSVTTPDMPGSGGAASHVAPYPGGRGGGLVQISAAGTVTINGAILANGERGTWPLGTYSGSGSGGGIAITCAALTGAGTIAANGEQGAFYSGSGGGGRIALNCPDCTNWFGVVQVDTGTSSPGERGTLYIQDLAFLKPVETNQAFRLYGFSSWSPPSLAMTNSYIGFEDAPFTLTVGSDLVLSASTLALSNATVVVGSNVVEGSSRINLYGFATNLVSLDVGGSLTLTNGSTLSVYSGMTNGIAPLYGALVSVTGVVSLATNCTIYPYSHNTNGGSVFFRAASLAMALGSAIDANGKGYAGYLPGDWYQPGRGPGGGRGQDNASISAGGYGGQGGNASAGYSLTYGSSNAPTDPGSGGSSPGPYIGYADVDQHGGGLVWIDVAGGTATLNGTITASTAGDGAAARYFGGGSGGGIYLIASKLEGAGALRANGASHTDANEGGSGGGGRIALRGWAADLFTGAVTVDPGSDSVAGHRGATGTIVRVMDAAYTWTLLVRGSPVRHGLASPYDYGRWAFTANAVATNAVPLTTEETADMRYTCYGWMVTNSAGAVVGSGVGTQSVVTLTNDLTQVWNWTNQYYLSTTAGTNGGLQADKTDWYTSGVPVTVAATANTDYVFLQWTGGGVPVGASFQNPLIVTMDQARAVQATFVSSLPTNRTWAGTGNWLSSTNWTPTGVPGPQDNVTIQSGAATVSDPISIATLIVSNGATLVFTNWNVMLTASSVVIQSGATVTQGVNSATATNASGQWVPDARVRFACTNFTLEAGARIDVTGAGFGSPTNGDLAGYGPGAGGANQGGGGGGYGGAGAAAGPLAWPAYGDMRGYPGAVYGSVSAPDWPGSGGGSSHLGPPYAGGRGGGLVQILASGAVTLNGIVKADGTLRSGQYGGAGSGGGIYVSCATFSGSGALTANGRDGSDYAGVGGGGRIAIECTNCTGWSGITQTKMGTGGYTPGQYGTFYLRDVRFLNPISTTNQLFQLWGLTSWSPSSLSMSNSYLGLNDPGFALTVSNDLTLIGSTLERTNAGFTVGGNLTLNGSRLKLNGLSTNLVSLSVAGNMLMTNGSTFSVYSGMTNGGVPDYGALVSVNGALTMAGGCTNYLYSHNTNGGSALVRLGRLTVAAGATIDAAGKGYAGFLTGDSYHAGRGPGGGRGELNNLISGAGYGGQGGKATLGYGLTYGSSNAPIEPGSGASCPNWNYADLDQAGGGVVRIDASGGKVTIDGGITATTSGDGSVGQYIGGGAGGSIYIICKVFEGAGSLNAKGANHTSAAEGGGGGGGRIAIWSQINTFPTNNATVAGGTSPVQPGGAGTMVWGSLKPPGTLFVVH